jgi:hypothetical protein
VLGFRGGREIGLAADGAAKNTSVSMVTDHTVRQAAWRIAAAKRRRRGLALIQLVLPAKRP